MKFWRWLCLLAIGLNLAACATSTPTTVVTAEPTAEDAAVTRPVGWNEASHGDSAEPNYAVVFAQNKVNQLTITIDSASWQAMQDNMTELLGEPGSRQMGGGFPGGVFTDTAGLPMRPGGAFTDTLGMPMRPMVRLLILLECQCYQVVLLLIQTECLVVLAAECPIWAIFQSKTQCGSRQH